MTRHEQTQIVFDGTVRAILFVLIVICLNGFMHGFFKGLGFSSLWSIPVMVIPTIYLHHFFKKVLK